MRTLYYYSACTHILPAIYFAVHCTYYCIYAVLHDAPGEMVSGALLPLGAHHLQPHHLRRLIEEMKQSSERNILPFPATSSPYPWDPLLPHANIPMGGRRLAHFALCNGGRARQDCLLLVWFGSAHTVAILVVCRGCVPTTQHIQPGISLLTLSWLPGVWCAWWPCLLPFPGVSGSLELDSAPPSALYHDLLLVAIIALQTIRSPLLSSLHLHQI